MPTIFDDPVWDALQRQKIITWYKDRGLREPAPKVVIAKTLTSRPKVPPDSRSPQAADDSCAPGGALIVFKTISDHPRVVIQRDRNRTRLGFAYGGIEKTDRDIFHTAMREGQEETGVVVNITQEHLVGRILRGSYTISVFLVNIPADTKLVPGEEQEMVSFVLPETIDHWIKQGDNLKFNHIEAWQMVRDRKLIQ